MKRFVLVVAALVVLAIGAAAQAEWPVLSASSPGCCPELVLAAGQGDVPTIEAYLSAGEFVDTRDPWTGMTALMAAAEHGWAEAVRYLLAAGANPQLRNVAGLTAYELATRAGFRAAADLLALR